MKRIILIVLALVMIVLSVTSCSSGNNDSVSVDLMSEAEIAALREKVVFETDNFSIDGMMMKYMLNRSAVEGHILLTVCGADLSKSLRDQDFNVSEANEKLFSEIIENSEDYKGFQGSWYDFLWTYTSDRAKETLALCETAKVKDIQLDAADLSKVEKDVDGVMKNLNVFGNGGNIFYYTVPNGSFGDVFFGEVGGGAVSVESDFKIVVGENSFNGGAFQPIGSGDNVTYLPVGSGDGNAFVGGFVVQGGFTASFNAVYGTGVSRDDVLKVMKLEALAEKCRDMLSEELRETIKKDSARIESYFETNRDDFYKVDYLSFIIPGNGDAQYMAELMSKTKTESEFRTQAVSLLFDNVWQMNYDKTITELKKGNGFGDGRYLTDEDIPSREDIQAKKEEARETVIRGLLNGDDVNDLPTFDDGIFDEAIRMVRDRIYEDIADEYDAITVKYGKLDGEKAADMWTFFEGRKVGDMSTFEVKDEEKDINTLEVRFIIKPRYLDETLAVSFGHILLSSEKHKSDGEALKVAEELLAQLENGELTKETFKTLAIENTEDTGVFYNDMIPGKATKAINDWFFSGERKVGDLGIVKSEYGYHVIYLTEIGELAAWKVEVIDALLEVDLAAFVDSQLKNSEMKYCGDEVKESIEIIGRRMLGLTSSSSGTPDFEIVTKP